MFGCSRRKDIFHQRFIFDPSHFRKLAKNREKAADEKRPFLTAVHHIVAGGAEAAELTRELLQGFGININDADNGVFLTANKGTA
jgi:hypothetical protein